MQRVILFLGWSIAAASAIGAAAFFIALFVIACRLVPANHEGDLGTWSGAVFAGLAFAGTVWLATVDSRRRRRQERAHASLVFTILQVKLTDARIHCKVLSEALDRLDPKAPQNFPRDFTDKTFKALKLWTLEDLIPLTFTHPKVARRLAQALGDMNFLADNFGESDFAYMCSDENALNFVRNASRRISTELHALLQLCIPLGMGIDVREEHQ